ncbi:MAG: 30S ribosomal protein S5 [Thermoplasmata archaeon]|nr:30S ribosomal protein S5 [Thermoplasmata archaeon]
MVDWMPKTRLGRMVVDGKITTMGDALRTGLPLREPEIVDILLPDLTDEVLDVNMVQRMTDSGRKVRFAITVVVGNQDGFVGLGRTKGREVGPAIRTAIDVAKLDIIEVKRGCGSWECGCLTPHSLPFEIEGHTGSVVVRLKPAPRGTGLAIGDIAKSVLKMAGVQDAWGFTKGHTKTTVNYSIAAFEALRATSQMRVTDEQRERLKIVSGPVKMHMAPSIVVEESVETEKEAKAEETPKEAVPAADATVKKEEA